MFIDPLESRQMLAGNYDMLSSSLFAKLSRTGTLFITGTSVRDTITVKQSVLDLALPRKLFVSVSLSSKYAAEAQVQPTFNFPIGDVKRINISSGAGDDLVVVNTGVKGRTVIHGGKGDDRLETTGRSGSLFGDSGNDILTSQSPVSIALESVSLPIGDGQRAVRYSYNLLTGGDGNDTFRTRGSDDSIIGGGGNDRYEPLEAGIVITTGTTLPTVSYPSGTVYGVARIALDSIEVLAPEPTDTTDVKVLLNGEWNQGLVETTPIS